MASITGAAALHIAKHHKQSTDPAIRAEAEFMEPRFAKLIESYEKRLIREAARGGHGASNGQPRRRPAVAQGAS